MAIMEQEETVQPQIQRLVNEPNISVQCNGEGVYTIQIQTTEEAMAGCVQIIHALLGLNGRMQRAVKACASQERGSHIANLLHFQQEGIAKLYWEYRGRGYKHRDSIKIVLEQQLAIDLKCTSADVAHFAKCYPPKELGHNQQEGRLLQ